jgi:hypothetical protein
VCVPQLSVVYKSLGIIEGFKCFSQVCFEDSQLAAAGLFRHIIDAPETSLSMLTRTEVSDLASCREDVGGLLRMVGTV